MPFASMSNETSTSGSPLRAWRMPVQHELAEQVVLLGHVALALQHADLHRRLVVARRGEDVALAHRHRRVALDQLREVPAERRDAERERRHVEQQQVLLLGDAAPRPGSPRRPRRPRRGSRPCADACRRSPRPPAARAACASGRRPGSPDRCPAACTPASSMQLLDGLQRLAHDVVHQLLELLAREHRSRGGAGRSRRSR